MNRIIYRFILLLFLFTVTVTLRSGTEPKYRYRWVFVHKNLNSDYQIGELFTIIQLASKNGLNGIVLSANLDYIDSADSGYLRRLNTIRELCRQYGLEIIPMIFNLEYGGSVLGTNKNLAEGFPVIDQPYLVIDGILRLRQDRNLQFRNGGFEKYQNHRLENYRYQSTPGLVSFVDSQIYKEGHHSILLKPFENKSSNHVYLTQDMILDPYRSYQISFWLKSDKLVFDRSGGFRVEINGPGNEFIQRLDIPLTANQKWRQIDMGFNSLKYTRVTITLGLFNALGGKCWMDSIQIRETGPVNILRRTGTPVTVKNEDTGRIYKEQFDYSPMMDTGLNYKFDHDAPLIRILDGSGIQEGDLLRISYYQGISILQGEIAVCLSEEQVYEIMERKLKYIHGILSPDKYFLALGELRQSGHCRACQNRRISMAEILGDSITRQYGMIKKLNPKADIFIWSDMLDPNHNAVTNYFMVEGDLTGSWNYIPKDIHIVCWYHLLRGQSLNHFSSHGFKVLASALADTNSMEITRDWLESMDPIENACGIIYTTWQNKYGLLSQFGDLVKNRNQSGDE